MTCFTIFIHKKSIVITKFGKPKSHTHDIKKYSDITG